jgi:hypothetical protein
MARPLFVSVLALVVSAVPARVAPAQPPLLERLAEYRVVDASGRIAPRAVAAGPGRVALRPAYPPPLLLRGRPYYFSGYYGATYGPLVPTGYWPGHGHGHVHDR